MRTQRPQRKPIEAYRHDLIAIVGEDGAVIAMGWVSGAQGGMSPLTEPEALQIRAYIDRFLAARDV